MWHTDGMFSSGWHGVGMLIWLFIIVMVLVVIVKIFSTKKKVSSAALDILDERYAKGELTDEEYQERKIELTK